MATNDMDAYLHVCHSGVASVFVTGAEERDLVIELVEVFLASDDLFSRLCTNKSLGTEKNRSQSYSLRRTATLLVHEERDTSVSRIWGGRHLNNLHTVNITIVSSDAEGSCTSG